MTLLLNADRLAVIREHVKEAQRLAQQEAHDTHQDRRTCRLALGLHLCRELADEIYEEAVDGERGPTHGRMEREHW